MYSWNALLPRTGVTTRISRKHPVQSREREENEHVNSSRTSFLDQGFLSKSNTLMDKIYTLVYLRRRQKYGELSNHHRGSYPPHSNLQLYDSSFTWTEYIRRNVFIFTVQMSPSGAEWNSPRTENIVPLSQAETPSRRPPYHSKSACIVRFYTGKKSPHYPGLHLSGDAFLGLNLHAP